MLVHFPHTEVMAVVVTASVYMREIVKDIQRKNKYSGHDLVRARTVSIELTFAGLHALKPAVISVSVVSTSTVPKPSTTRSATTYSVGLCKLAAL